MSMIEAYKEDYGRIAQVKMAEMFELAALKEKIKIDDFIEMFIDSPICRAFETLDPIYLLGKSSNELIAMIINKPPVDIYVAEYASPEFWTGYVLAYAQVTLNKSYRTLVKAFPCSEILIHYFPYHEMDNRHILDVFKEKLQKNNPLRTLRLERKLSQSDLALLSNVNIRSIKGYEQGTLDISKAQVDTVFALARVLGCSLEKLFY